MTTVNKIESLIHHLSSQSSNLSAVQFKLFFTIHRCQQPHESFWKYFLLLIGVVPQKIEFFLIEHQTFGFGPAKKFNGHGDLLLGKNAWNEAIYVMFQVYSKLFLFHSCSLSQLSFLIVITSTCIIILMHLRNGWIALTTCFRAFYSCYNITHDFWYFSWWSQCSFTSIWCTLF